MRGILGLAPLDLSSFKGQSLVKKQDDSDREVFSVSPTATEGQVHKAYFKLSIAHHPDKFTDPDEKSTANLRFNELTEIYERLVASTRNRESESNDPLGFYEACAHGNLSSVIKLLKNPTLDVNERNSTTGFTPFEVAIHSGNWSIVLTLLNEYECQQANRKLVQSQQEQMSEALILAPKNQLDIDLNSLDDEGNSLLHKICLAAPPTLATTSTPSAVNGHKATVSRSVYSQMVDILLNHMRYDHINATNKQGKTALHLVCEQGGFEAFSQFLLHPSKIDIHACDAEGYTALHIACQSGWQAIALQLAQYNVTHLDAQNNQGHTPIYLCFINKNLPLFKKLYTEVNRFDLNIPDAKGKTILFYVCEKHDHRAFDELMRLPISSLDLYKEDNDGRSPFSVADEKMKAHLFAVTYIEEVYEPWILQSYPNKSTRCKRSYLIGALVKGQYETASQAIKYEVGRPVDEKKKFILSASETYAAIVERNDDECERTLLHLTVLGKHPENAKLLLCLPYIRDNFQKKDKYGYSAIDYVCRLDVRGLTRSFLETDVPLTEEQATKLFFQSCIQGELDSVELLRDYCSKLINYNYASSSKGNCFINACKNNQLAVVELLLTMPEVSKKTLDSGDSALLIACKEGHTDIVNTLLANNECLQTVKDFGACVHHAFINHNWGIVDALLKEPFLTTYSNEIIALAFEKQCIELLYYLKNTKQIICNLPKNKLGYTAFFTACAEGKAKIAQFLIAQDDRVNPEDHEANVTGSNRQKVQKTPLDIACENGHIDVVHLLLSHPKFKNAWLNGLKESDNQKAKYCTPLIFACKNNHYAIVEQLIEEPDLDPNFPEASGSTPLHIMCKSSPRKEQKNEAIRLKILALLLNHPSIDTTKKHLREPDNLALSHSSSRLNVPEEPIKKRIIIPLQSRVQGKNRTVSWILKLLDQAGNDRTKKGNIVLTAYQYGCSELTTVDALLENDQTLVNFVNDQNESPLHLACKTQDIPAVKKLLNYQSIDLNLLTKTGKSALQIACETGNRGLVKLLLPFFLCLNRRHMETAVDAAYQLEEFDIVKLFLEIQGDYPLYFFSYLIKNKDLDDHYLSRCFLDFLYKNFDFSAKDTDGKTPFFLICEKQSTKNIKPFLEKFPGIDGIADNQGRTPCYIAAQEGKHVLVEILIKNQTRSDNLYAPASNGKTPLMIACEKGQVEVVKLLLTAPELAINSADKQGQTALALACTHSNRTLDPKNNPHVQIVTLLLNSEKLLDKNKKNNQGKTPLILAVEKNDIVMVEMLIIAGADIQSKDHRHFTAPMSAAREGYGEILCALIKKLLEDITEFADIKEILDPCLYTARYEGYGNEICDALQKLNDRLVNKAIEEFSQIHRGAIESNEERRIIPTEQACKEAEERHMSEQEAPFSNMQTNPAKADDHEEISAPPPQTCTDAIILHTTFLSTMEAPKDVFKQKQQYLQALFNYFGPVTEQKTHEALNFVNYLITKKGEHFLSKERNTLHPRHNPKAKSFIMTLRFFVEKYPNTREAILSLIKTDPSILEWHGNKSIDITYHDGASMITVALPTLEKRGPAYGVKSNTHGFKYIKDAALPAATYNELNDLFKQGVKDKQGYIDNVTLYFHQAYYFTENNALNAYGKNIDTLKQEAYHFVESLLADTKNYCQEVRTSKFLIFSRPQGFRAKENMTRSYCELLRFFIDTFGEVKLHTNGQNLEKLIINTLNEKLSDEDFNKTPGQDPLKYLSGRPQYIDDTVGELKKDHNNSSLVWKSK